MHQKEIEFLKSFLQPQDIMLEWGAGGSTLYYSTLVNKYYSIEHDSGWYNKLLPNIPENVKMFNILNDKPRTTPTQKHQFQTYIDFIDELKIPQYDKILIDGRARGWCAEKALHYIHENSIVFIHDYFNRPQYHIVENWYKVIGV